MSTTTVDVLAPKGVSRVDRHAAHIAVTCGISQADAHLLMTIASCDGEGAGIDASAFDEDGRGSLLWLVHRGLVYLTNHLGCLYVRQTSAGCRAVIDGRAKLVAEDRRRK